MTTADRTVRVWGIVPAAGVGRRMGRSKQALPYRDSTLTSTVVRTLLSSGVNGIVVVTRTSLLEALELPDDPRVEIALNDNDTSQMIDSVRIGLAGLGNEPPSSTDGILVVPADMPSLLADTCRRCMDAYVRDPGRIIIATCEARRGHPIIFPFSMGSAVDRLDGGLNELPKQFPERVTLVEVDDPGTLVDVDTPADYDQLSVQRADDKTKPR